jgi:glycosyltransferase involved in cell wall biosynthesis
MKILLIHTNYRLEGGEDSVVKNEFKHLSKYFTVEHIYLKNKTGLSGAIQFLFSLWNIFEAMRLKKKIRIINPDIIHIHNWHYAIGPIIFWVSKSLKKPVIHTLHNYRIICPSAILISKNQLFTASIKSSFSWQAVKKKVYRKSYIQTFWLSFILWFHKKIGTWKIVDKFILLTDFSKKIIMDSKVGINEHKICIKGNFTELVPIKINQEKKNHFLFVGRLSEEKGLQILLDAFKTSKFKLQIIGDGPLRTLVDDYSEKYENIKYLGAQNHNEVIKQLHICSACIIPSICFEGMPMTILEAFSTKTSVIASNIGAMSTMVKSGFNGFLFESGNSNALRETLEKWHSLQSNDKMRIRENCFHDFFSKYSPESNLNQLITIYRDVIKEKS